MSAPVRIAVLKCDTPNPAVLAAYGDYRAIFSTLFEKSLQAFKASAPGTENVEFVVDDFHVRDDMKYPNNIDLYDAVLLTGSSASAYENLEWINKLVEFVRFVATDRPNVRLIGICFGHQIIARALGGECVPNDGKWEIGPTKLDLTEAGKKLFGVPELNIQQMHRDHVPKVPSSFHLLGSSPVSPNQGMVELYPGASPESLKPEDVHIFTVQGHPEFHQQIVDEIVKARSSIGVFDNANVEDYQQRAEWKNDGVDVVGKTIWNILCAARG
ncbi:class I glutamine amidotransferase-like protein [Epithele typhae]|uniref:class I glutamine amidotransferase-like protein n=1 Tax=Epithele typhae TaxID=378194 RepID=UPI00200859B1|nr:class I glutamine amidotransferase-like protein [Epithele typhae]KAH9919503.1 class I glutamine amidotransferase-like protein [Epithele typhae]